MNFHNEKEDGTKEEAVLNKARRELGLIHYN